MTTLSDLDAAARVVYQAMNATPQQRWPLLHARCGTVAAERGWHLVPSFDMLLVRGVASYALELLRGVPTLDILYVPIGLGSGICGAIAARDALGLSTRIVGGGS